MFARGRQPKARKGGQRPAHGQIPIHPYNEEDHKIPSPKRERVRVREFLPGGKEDASALFM